MIYILLNEIEIIVPISNSDFEFPNSKSVIPISKNIFSNSTRFRPIRNRNYRIQLRITEIPNSKFRIQFEIDLEIEIFRLCTPLPTP